MECSKRNPVSTKITWLVACVALLFVFAGCKKVNLVPHLSITTVASGLAGPMGIETDSYGNIWVSEGGTDTLDTNGSTHNNDGKVIVITPNGKQYDAIINLSSYKNAASGQLQGTVHILRDGSTLYVLSGDYLYRADISHFKPGDKPIDAGTLPFEDIASVIRQIPSANNPEKDSHPYNLTKGPDGNLYITDAGANAILKRTGVNNYSILAEIPNFSNPTNPLIGGPIVQAVPTSIRYDGSNFLVTTLTGFPFLEGQATIYKVSLSGNVSVYQKGFTMLVDQAPGNSSNHIVVQYASSFSLATEYAPNSGALLWVNGSTTKVLAGGLNQPVSIKQVNNYTWYVTSLGDGSVLKVTYE
ncbi:MAG TPA: ScyD/ScyE family protein [Hanamia sp.]|nr:ScyD/ScyE family protein [Hanamia sp.]